MFRSRRSTVNILLAGESLKRELNAGILNQREVCSVDLIITATMMYIYAFISPRILHYGFNVNI